MASSISYENLAGVLDLLEQENPNDSEITFLNDCLVSLDDLSKSHGNFLSSYSDSSLPKQYDDDNKAYDGFVNSIRAFKEKWDTADSDGAPSRGGPGGVVPATISTIGSTGGGNGGNDDDSKNKNKKKKKTDDDIQSNGVSVINNDTGEGVSSDENSDSQITDDSANGNESINIESTTGDDSVTVNGSTNGVEGNNDSDENNINGNNSENSSGSNSNVLASNENINTNNGKSKQYNSNSSTNTNNGLGFVGGFGTNGNMSSSLNNGTLDRLDTALSDEPSTLLNSVDASLNDLGESIIKNGKDSLLNSDLLNFGKIKSALDKNGKDDSKINWLLLALIAGGTATGGYIVSKKLKNKEDEKDEGVKSWS